MFQENPALGICPNALDIGWVLEVDGAIAGYFGNVLMPYWFRGQTILAACASIWGVLPDQRGHSLALAKRFFSQKGPNLLVNTTANPGASSVFSLMKAVRPTPDHYDSISYWVTDAASMARSLARQRLPRLLQAPGTGLLTLGIETALFALRRRPRRFHSAFEVRAMKVRDVGTEFDFLWQSARERRTELMAVRSAEMLRWHYADPSGVREPALIACYRKGTLVGYAVVRRDDVVRMALPRLRLVDIFLAEDLPRAIDLLIWGVYEEAQRRGVALLELNLLPGIVRQRLTGIPRFVRKQEQGSTYLKAATRELAESLGDPPAWWLTRYDGDASL
jgi:hypothetical protein